jgi:hypothetical protein
MVATQKGTQTFLFQAGEQVLQQGPALEDQHLLPVLFLMPNIQQNISSKPKHGYLSDIVCKIISEMRIIPTESRYSLQFHRY